MNKKPELLPSCRLNLPGGKKRILLVLLVMMLSVVTSFAQSVNVKGRVIDKNGDPVIGATVVEVGSKGNGTVTDIDGNYTALPLKAVLRKCRFRPSDTRR